MRFIKYGIKVLLLIDTCKMDHGKSESHSKYIQKMENISINMDKNMMDLQMMMIKYMMSYHIEYKNQVK
jgi:hypothetical protein